MTGSIEAQKIAWPEIFLLVYKQEIIGNHLKCPFFPKLLYSSGYQTVGIAMAVRGPREVVFVCSTHCAVSLYHCLCLFSVNVCQV